MPRGVGHYHCRTPVLSPWPWTRQCLWKGAWTLLSPEQNCIGNTRTEYDIVKRKRKEKTFGCLVYKETLPPAPAPRGPGPPPWMGNRPKIRVVLVDRIKQCFGPRGSVYVWLKGLRADKKVLSPVLLKHIAVLMFQRDRHIRSTWHRSRHQQCH